jgi:phage shock protein PspC (stress-responsive transcriptional regulator)
MNNDTHNKRLYRSSNNRVVFGVAGGLGEYFNIDPIIFRILFVALVLGGGFGLIAYLLLAFFVPSEPRGASGTAAADSTDFGQRARGLGRELEQAVAGIEGRRGTLGLVIILIGLFLLLNQVSPWPIFSWGIIWAVVIMLIGFYIMRQPAGRRVKTSAVEPEPTPADEPSRTEPQVKPQREVMSPTRLFFGLLLLLLGVGLVIQNLGLWPALQIDWLPLLRLWPVVIVLFGLSLLAGRSRLGRMLGYLITILIVLLVIAFVLLRPQAGPISTTVSDFIITREAQAERANIVVDGGAGVINISGTEQADLVTGFLRSNMTNLDTTSTIADDTQEVEVGMRGETWTFRGQPANRLTMRVADDLPISLRINAGASDLVLDASSLRLEDLRVDTGASRVQITFGELVPEVRAEIKAGASAITVTLPHELGTRLEVRGALMGRNFPGFTQLERGVYQTTNYETATNRLNLSVEAGVSNLNIIRFIE